LKSCIALEFLTEVCRNSSARGGLRTVSSNKFSPTRIDLYANEADCLSDQVIMLEINKKLCFIVSSEKAFELAKIRREKEGIQDISSV
jgi:hypothetical protein